MARTAQHTEREMKLDAGTLDGRLGPGLFDGMETISDDTVTLRAEYWDTRDLRLTSWGHEVRYRVASDGSEAVWTVKFAGVGGHDALMDRQELEFSGDGQSPPHDVRNVVVAFTGHEALVPLATVTTDRHRIRLRAGDTIVEVADDRVTSRLGRRIGPGLHELEVELVEGSTDMLRKVTSKLRAAGARPGSSESKIARVVAERLAGAPPRLQHQELKAGSTLGELVTGALTDGTLRLLAHDPALRTTDEPEAVHQARVATRRLRSDLRTLEPMLVESRVAPLRSELRWLGRLLGAVRDLDVLAAHLDEVAAGARETDAADIGRLVGHLRTERAQRMLELRDVLTSDRYVTLVEDLGRAARTPRSGPTSTSTPPPTDPAGDSRRAPGSAPPATSAGSDPSRPRWRCTRSGGAPSGRATPSSSSRPSSVATSPAGSPSV